jgi:hypothetical protein
MLSINPQVGVSFMPVRDRSFLPRLVIAIFLWCAASVSAQNAPVTINVDSHLNHRSIDPNIYDVAHATTAQLNALNSPLNRNGGNNTTRYNWQLNADNRANDWFGSTSNGTTHTHDRDTSEIVRELCTKKIFGNRGSNPIGKIEKGQNS